MKTLKKWMSLAAVPALLLCFACTPHTGGPSEGGYSDTAPRPEIEYPEIAEQVVYPEKPASAPAAPDESKKPSVTSYTSSREKGGYTVTTGTTTTVEYADVNDWAYVYAAVENYSPTYGNIKLTIDNKTPAAERIAIQAVYYEAYDLGYTPVTVYLGDLVEGEQYVIAELGEHTITDETYHKVNGQSVKDKTIIGFVIFLDSVPSFPAHDDKEGKLDIVSFEFLKDGDPALEDRYVKPSVSFSEATATNGVTLDAGETLKATVTGAGSVTIPVAKYTADYTKYSVKVSGPQSASVKLSVSYTFGSGDLRSAEETFALESGDTTHEYDFSVLRPTAGGDDLTTRFVKDGTVTAIVLSFETEGVYEIKEAAFVRTATDGAYVSDAWTSSASDVSIVRAANGGNAKIEYAYYESWFNFSVPVRRGDNVKKIVLTVYAPDGLDHLGIGITNTSPNSSAGQSMGTFILRGAASVFDWEKSTLVGTIDGAVEPNLSGVTETLAYDKEAKTYTVTFDFSAMQLDSDNKTLSDYTLSSLIFYLNCSDANEAHKFEGKRTLYFLSIDLLS